MAEELLPNLSGLKGIKISVAISASGRHGIQNQLMYDKLNITENHLQILLLFTNGFDKARFLVKCKSLLSKLNEKKINGIRKEFQERIK